MSTDQVQDLLTSDEELSWLRSVARHLLEPTISTRPLTRNEVLDCLAAVLAESREPPARVASNEEGGAREGRAGASKGTGEFDASSAPMRPQTCGISKRRARGPGCARTRGRAPVLRAMQARGGPSPQAEGQGADPPHPKGRWSRVQLEACLAQPIVYEEEVDGPVPPKLARLHVRDGCVRAP